MNLRWGIIAAFSALVISVSLGIISDVRPLHIFLRALIFTVVFFGVGFGARMVITSFIPELLYLEEEPVIRENNQQSGSRINISVGNEEYAVPEMYKAPGEPHELGNIEDLISGAFKPRVVAESPADQFPKAPASWESVDVNRENDYNMQGGDQDGFDADMFEIQPEKPSKKAPPEKPVFTASFGDDMSGLGGLPDLDAMATAFSAGGGDVKAPPVQAAPAMDMDSGFMDPMDSQLFGGDAMAESLKTDSSNKTGNKNQQLEGDFSPKELSMGIRTVLSKDK